VRSGRRRGIFRRSHTAVPPRIESAPISIAASLLPEFDQEMATTRRLLERVPSERGQWKPHSKSFPLGHLAQLISWMPGWIATTLRRTELDLAGGAAYSFETTQKLLKEFDKNVREAREALASTADADWAVPWSLKHGDRVLYTAPRGSVVRSHISHLIHHRGQLSVYLRECDIPIPMIYGPTADERW
jgi:uncharacterized damage-inducible protein DinB